MNVRRWKLWGGGLVGILLLGVVVYMSQTPSVSREEVIALVNQVPLPFDRTGAMGMRFENVLEQSTGGDIVLGHFDETILERFSSQVSAYGGIRIHGYIYGYDSEAKAADLYRRHSAHPKHSDPHPIALGEHAIVSTTYRRMLNRQYILQRCQLALKITVSGSHTIGVTQFEEETDRFVRELDQQLQTLCR